MSTSEAGDSTLLLRAMAFNRVGKHDKARADLKSALLLSPDNPDVLLELGRLLVYEDKPDSAIHVLKKISGRGRSSSDANIELGKLCFYNENYPQCLFHLNKAVSADSLNKEAWFYRGNFFSSFVDGQDSAGAIWYKYLNLNQALHDLDRAIQLDSNYHEAYFKRAMVHFNKFDDENGFSDLNEAIRISPLTSYYYAVKAQQMEKRGQYDEARTLYLKVLELNPADSVARAALRK